MLVSSFILSKLLSTNKSNSIYVPYSINFISKYVLSDCSKKLEIIVIISVQILYLIFDYPHKHYTFKYFKV